MTRVGTVAAPPRLAWAMACAALVGFVSLAWEILWIRVHMFASGGTLSVFGIFLGVYLLGIATGALVARRACAPGAVGSVRRLARTHLGPLELGDLPAGASRSLTHEELAELRALCGLDAPPVDAADGAFLSSRDR